MIALPELPELKKLNCKVLDINDADLTGIIPNRESEFKNALQLIREEYDHKAMASDLIRYALLAKGTDAIDKASHSKISRATKGMIYMDTDRGPTISRLPKWGDEAWLGPEIDGPCQWGDMEAPAGMLFNDNDLLVTTFEQHPVFLSVLNAAIDRLEENKGKFTKSGPTTALVLETTEPFLFFDAVEKYLHYNKIESSPELEFRSPVAGHPRNDKTWITDAPKVDLSASWMSKLPGQRRQRNDSTCSFGLIS